MAPGGRIPGAEGLEGLAPLLVAALAAGALAYRAVRALWFQRRGRRATGSVVARHGRGEDVVVRTRYADRTGGQHEIGISRSMPRGQRVDLRDDPARPECAQVPEPPLAALLITLLLAALAVSLAVAAFGDREILDRALRWVTGS